MQKNKNLNFVLILVKMCSNEPERTTQVILIRIVLCCLYPVEPNTHTPSMHTHTHTHTNQLSLEYVSEVKSGGK